MINTLINLRQRYENYTRKQYNKHYFEYDFKPQFKWNPFDTDNDWVYDLEKWRNFIWGWQSVGYAWEAWSYWMRDKKYQYKLPHAMWAELNTGYMEMEVYCWTKKGAKPERIVLPAEDYDALVERLNEPPDPKVVERVGELMSKKAPWED